MNLLLFNADDEEKGERFQNFGLIGSLRLKIKTPSP